VFFASDIIQLITNTRGSVGGEPLLVNVGANKACIVLGGWQTTDFLVPK
jgi:hypothetical protein